MFPECCGLRTQDNTYLSIKDNNVFPPIEEWEQTIYYVIKAESSKNEIEA
jgi:hypothetical protein